MTCRCVPQSHHFSYIYSFLGWKVDTFDRYQFAPVWIYWKKEILTRGSTMSKSISADEMSRRSRVTIWPAHPSLTKLQLLHHPPTGLQKFSLLKQELISATSFKTWVVHPKQQGVQMLQTYSADLASLLLSNRQQAGWKMWTHLDIFHCSCSSLPERRR